MYLNRLGPPKNLVYQLECAQKDKFPKAKVNNDLEEELEPKS